MAVTVTSTLVKPITTDPARTAGGAPDKSGHAGWGNAYGDPHWIADVDWWHRYQLRCSGSAGEVGSIVNWELFDGTIQLKTTAQIAALADKTSGALINNTDTWTVWAYTGVNVAGKAYVNTGTSAIPTLRANGPTVQVVLGPWDKIGDPAVTWTIYAFLPGGGKTPAGSTTQAVQNRATYDQPATVSVSGTATITSPATTTVLTATVTPAGAYQAVTWTSSNPAKATVASTTALTGTVTAAGGGAAQNGTTVIKAVAVGNSSIQSAGTTVTVSGFSLRAGEKESASEAVEKATEAVKEEVASGEEEHKKSRRFKR